MSMRYFLPALIMASFVAAQSARAQADKAPAGTAEAAPKSGNMADRSWTEVEKALRLPAPPAEWRNKPPTKWKSFLRRATDSDPDEVAVGPESPYRCILLPPVVATWRAVARPRFPIQKFEFSLVTFRRVGLNADS